MLSAPTFCLLNLPHFWEALMRRAFVVFTLLPCLLICSLASAQSKHPFTFEDMMALKRVNEPVPSPDGKWVLFSAVDVNLDANTKTPHVWIVPLAGGESREIISDQDADRPRWAPDGKRFLFVSSKEGGSQVWIADFEGSAGTVTGRHKLTSFATGADGPIWSPDGKNIAFTSRVYPGCADEACNKKKMDDVANSKVKAPIFTRLLYRHWNAFQAGRRSHIFVIPVDACVATAALACPAGAARDLTPRDNDVPPCRLAGQDDYAFSPDGQEICYTSNHDPEPAISTNNDLFTVPVSGEAGVSPAQVLAATKNITAENKAADNTPLYSPDGKYIAYRAQQRPGYESDRFRLMLYDRKYKTIADATEDFDRWVGSFAWASNAQH